MLWFHQMGILLKKSLLSNNLIIMKINKLFIALSLIGGSLLIASCNKDDEEKDGGKFTYDEVTYELVTGQLMSYGAYDSVFNQGLVLFSSGINVDPVTGDAISGIGDFISFDLYSSNPDELDPVVYTSAGHTQAGSIEYGVFAINANMQSETADLMKLLVEVTLDVDKDGDRYVLDFTGSDPQGKNVEGHFEGPLDYFLYESKKKK